VYFPPPTPPHHTLRHRCPVGRAYITINTCVYDIIIIIIITIVYIRRAQIGFRPYAVFTHTQYYNNIMLYGIVNNDDVEQTEEKPRNKTRVYDFGVSEYVRYILEQLSGKPLRVRSVGQRCGGSIALIPRISENGLSLTETSDQILYIDYCNYIIIHSRVLRNNKK